MTVFFLVILLLVNVALLGLGALLFRRLSQASSQEDSLIRLARQAESLHQTLSQQFAASTADMASRLEQTKGDLRQQVSDRLADGFNGIRGAVEEQMTAGRREQSERLAEARTELTNSLALTTSQLKTQFDGLNQKRRRVWTRFATASTPS